MPKTASIVRLAAIYKELTRLGNVLVVAPASSKSGASHSVTFHEPLVCNKVEIEGAFSGFSVEGSPADCVKLAFMQLCPQKPDLLVAGINAGANAGINVYYSGTVAAAMEGAFLNIPAVALSLDRDEPMNFETAAKYCLDIIRKLLPVKSGAVYNINIPKLSKGKPKGVKVVTQANEGFEEYYIRQTNDLGQTVFQLAGSLDHTESESAENTDTNSLAAGFITITALNPDMTEHEKTGQLNKIFDSNFTLFL